MRCRSCGEDEVEMVRVPCLDEDGEQMLFSVCTNCDFGINQHTEGVCDCEAN